MSSVLSQGRFLALLVFFSRNRRIPRPSDGLSPVDSVSGKQPAFMPWDPVKNRPCSMTDIAADNELYLFFADEAAALNSETTGAQFTMLWNKNSADDKCA